MDLFERNFTGECILCGSIFPRRCSPRGEGFFMEVEPDLPELFEKTNKSKQVFSTQSNERH